MIHVVEYLSKALKAARERKQLSQRGLGKAVGMPQAQISRIENAAVDMQASTLIELARALDLEVMLVPRTHVPAVKHVIAATEHEAGEMASPRPVYALDGDGDGDGDDDDG